MIAYSWYWGTRATLMDARIGLVGWIFGLPAKTRNLLQILFRASLSLKTIWDAYLGLQPSCNFIPPPFLGPKLVSQLLLWWTFALCHDAWLCRWLLSPLPCQEPWCALPTLHYFLLAVRAPFSQLICWDCSSPCLPMNSTSLPFFFFFFFF